LVSIGRRSSHQPASRARGLLEFAVPTGWTISAAHEVGECGCVAWTCTEGRVEQDFGLQRGDDECQAEKGGAEEAGSGAPVRASGEETLGGCRGLEASPACGRPRRARGMLMPEREGRSMVRCQPWFEQAGRALRRDHDLGQGAQRLEPAGRKGSPPPKEVVLPDRGTVGNDGGGEGNDGRSFSST